MKTDKISYYDARADEMLIRSGSAVFPPKADLDPLPKSKLWLAQKTTLLSLQRATEISQTFENYSTQKA